MKSALNNNLLRADSSAPDFQEVRTSQQIVDFGNRHLGTPRAGAELFSDLSPATVLMRKDIDKEDPNDSKTVKGISNVYEIICQVRKTEKCEYFVNSESKPNTQNCSFQADATVLWRRFPCFCPPCQHNQWQDCQNIDIVGKVNIVRV